MSFQFYQYLFPPTAKFLWKKGLPFQVIYNIKIIPMFETLLYLYHVLSLRLISGLYCSSCHKLKDKGMVLSEVMPKIEKQGCFKVNITSLKGKTVGGQCF